MTPPDILDDPLKLPGFEIIRGDVDELSRTTPRAAPMSDVDGDCKRPRRRCVAWDEKMGDRPPLCATKNDESRPKGDACDVNQEGKERVMIGGKVFANTLRVNAPGPLDELVLLPPGIDARTEQDTCIATPIKSSRGLRINGQLPAT